MKVGTCIAKGIIVYVKDPLVPFMGILIVPGTRVVALAMSQVAGVIMVLETVKEI